MHVLILDDDRTLRSMLAMHFEEAGCDVLQAATCARCHAVLKDARRCQLALIDHELPDGRGLDMVDPLREANPSMEIIVISGCTDPALRSRLADMNIHYFLGKPFRPAELDAVVKRALEGT